MYYIIVFIIGIPIFLWLAKRGINLLVFYIYPVFSISSLWFLFSLFHGGYFSSPEYLIYQFAVTTILSVSTVVLFQHLLKRKASSDLLTIIQSAIFLLLAGLFLVPPLSSEYGFRQKFPGILPTFAFKNLEEEIINPLDSYHAVAYSFYFPNFLGIDGCKVQSIDGLLNSELISKLPNPKSPLNELPATGDVCVLQTLDNFSDQILISYENGIVFMTYD